MQQSVGIALNVEKGPGKTIIMIMIITAGLVLSSTLIVAAITGSLYLGAYYTISTLFDAVGFMPKISYVPLFTRDFYLFFGVLLIDGITKIIVIGFLIASVVEIVSSIDVISRLNLFAAKRLKDHIIICGYSGFSDRLITDLKEKKKDFVVIERDKVKIDELREEGYLAIEGNFAKEVYLNEASIKTAQAIVFDTENDFENLLGIITVKRFFKGVKIIARANNSASVTKMLRAGADQCVVPEMLAGIELGKYIKSSYRG